MNPYEAPQTVDQPPKKPWRRHWLWPDFSSRPASSQGSWGSSLGVVVVIVGMNLLRSCSQSSSVPNRLPNNTINQPQKNSPAVQELLEKIRAKRNPSAPQPPPKTLDQQ